jgi:hypothetical protein
MFRNPICVSVFNCEIFYVLMFVYLVDLIQVVMAFRVRGAM